MDTQQLLQWFIIGIVLLIGLSIVGFLLDLAVGLLSFAVKVLLVLLVVAVGLRFFRYLRE